MTMSSTTLRPASPLRPAPIGEKSLSRARAIDVLEAAGRALHETSELSPAVARFLRSRDCDFLLRAALEAGPLVESYARASALDAPEIERRLLWIEMGMIRAALALQTAPIPLRPPTSS
jgi:hypothetical protein